MLKLILIILAVLTFFYIFSELAELEHELKLRFSEHKWAETALVLLILFWPWFIFALIDNRDKIIKFFY
jgi:hypothetical protein